MSTAGVAKSVYEQIGGEPAMAAAVEVFYRKVLADDRISHFFEDVDMERQAAKQKAFLTMVTGGPSSYSGRDMRAGHAHLVKLGLNDMHFDAVVGHLKETLEELNVPAPLVQRVLTIAEGARADVLNR
ncbi:group 1 truncated hemoglobin [Pyxidicoccus fallax]|uniref:Group 1 truncated hemoglobin n=1 Tax=Pyxidicoccus fallax TaxID=394095 RepID=A0A848LIP1_9BACT|nr:group 1 truncated hemoglobin [Pyxidicoccus fallax]NMO17591.1 group 1 truncated hemoglobin [Pyxidicoccus fallax]NPC84482.1 group 1 truncated hemoglobin [Pyxidicoccus fallax]